MSGAPAAGQRERDDRVDQGLRGYAARYSIRPSSSAVSARQAACRSCEHERDAHDTGRALLTFATGIKLARPDLTVIAVMGDGDALAIGGNHLIHACRRNIDLTALILNNEIYGMTGGHWRQPRRRACARQQARLAASRRRSTPSSWCSQPARPMWPGRRPSTSTRCHG